jgi:glycosyltransferase involved in cell wall biosynthesis
MAAYNAIPFVGAAIDSILAQSFTDFEFIVVDDGSTDGTLAVLEDRARRDPRLRVVAEPHTGLPGPRNVGLRLAQGELIACMDADDISHPSRLERQVSFLDQHPEVGLCGAWEQVLDGQSGRVWRYPTADADIRCWQLFRPVLPASAAMMRAALAAAVGGYDPEFQTAEDYDLWVRLGERARVANVPAVLIQYRRHPAQKSIQDRISGRQAEESLRIQMRLLERLGLHPDEGERQIHSALMYRSFEHTPTFVERAADWLEGLAAGNAVHKRYDPEALSRVLAEHWYLVCRAAARQGLWAVRRYRRSPLARMHRLTLVQWLWFARRAGLHALRIPPRRKRPARPATKA